MCVGCVFANAINPQTWRVVQFLATYAKEIHQISSASKTPGLALLVHIDLFLFYVGLKFGSRGATGESWNRPCLWVLWWFVVANKLLGQKRAAFIVVRADVKQTLLMTGAAFISELRL